MEEPIAFSLLNDFIFCPASIFYHGMYDGVDKMVFTGKKQIAGTYAHKRIDDAQWPENEVLCACSVYCEKYGLYGKIDKFHLKTGELVESKNKIKNIYDGYIFQLYAQYFALCESGYTVKKMSLYSISDNKKYPIPLPEDDPAMLSKFENMLSAIRSFDLNGFKPSNINKCQNCIYAFACEWGEFA